MEKQSSLEKDLTQLVVCLSQLRAKGEISDAAFQTLSRHVLGMLVEAKLEREVYPRIDEIVMKVNERISRVF